MHSIKRLGIPDVKPLGLDNSEEEIFTTYYFWNDANHNNIWDKGEQLIFKLLIFTSRDGNKVREYYEDFSPKDDEVMLFLETDSDTFSKNVLYGKVPKKLQQHFTTQIKYYNKTFFDSGILEFVQGEFGGATKEIVEELLLKGYIERKGVQDTVVSGIRFFLANSSVFAKALGWIVEQVGEAIDLLKIPDKFWDDQNENYVFTKETLLNSLTIDTSGFINQVFQADSSSISYIIDIYGKANFEKQIDFFTAPVSKVAQAYNAFAIQMVEDAFAGLENNSEITEKLKQDFALLAGLWNGLVDFVSSTLKFIGNLAQAGFDIASNWEEFLETMDNILDSLASISFAEIWKGIKLLYNQVITYFSEADGLNWVRIAYMTGYGISFIGTMFIPIAGWVGKIAKVDKLIPDELLDILRKSGEALATKLTTKSKNAQLKILQQCDELLRVFAKGRQAIQEFFTKLADDIGKWFLKNRKIFSKVSEVEAFLIDLIRVLRKNPKYLDSLQYIKFIRRPLGRFLALEQEAAINLYTKSYYILFNRSLRKIEGKITVEYKAMQKVLDDSLEKLPISKYNKGVLLRSTYFSEENVKKLFKVGKDFTDAGYFSTTYSEKALLRWMKNNPTDNVLFKVYGKNGKLIEKSSDIIDEAEVLFKSNTTFFVESVQKIKHPILSRASNGEKVIEIILKEK